MTDPTLAPEGHSTLYVLLPVSHDTGSIDWANKTAGFRRLALEQMEKIGLKDVERRIVYEKVITPPDWCEDFDLYRGATFQWRIHLIRCFISGRTSL